MRTAKGGTETGWGDLILARARAAATCFAQPQLRRLELSWFGFNLAEYAVTVALGVYAFDQGGPAAVGLITLVRTLPAVLSAPLFSVLTDRLSRRTVLAIGYWGRALATGVMALALASGAPAPVIYMLAPVDVILASSIFPASAALIPDLSRRPEELSSANAAFSTMESAGALLGPLIAALLIATRNLLSVFVVAVAIYALAAVATRTLSSDRTIKSLRGLNLLSELRSGLATLRSHWDARSVVAMWTLESMLVGVVDVFVVVVALDILGWGDPGVGLLAAAVGVGGVLGAILSAASARSRAYGRVMVLASAIFGLGLAGAAIPVIAIVVASLALVGYAQGLTDVAGQTLLQRTTPSDALGRVLGLFEGLYWAAVGIGALIASLVIEWLGPISALMLFSGAAVLIALVFWRPLRRIDGEAHVALDKVSWFIDCALFTALPIPTVEYLANHARENDYPAGEVVMRQGDPGDDFHVIVDGEVDVVIDGDEVKTLGPSDYFGEIAILYDTPRTATVRARTDLTTMSVDAVSFVAVVTGYMGSSDMVTSMAQARLAENRERKPQD